MALLFKTFLIHIKKSAFVTSVFSFFVGLSVMVLASSDHLSDNLKKGFREIEYDGNSHDMIFSVKKFRPTHNIELDVNYFDKSSMKITPKWSYRWSWDSLKHEFWAKKDDYEEIVDESQRQEPSNSYSNTDLFKYVPDVVFSLPSNPQTTILRCEYSNTFLSNSDADINFLDRNEALIDLQHQEFPANFVKKCGTQITPFMSFTDSFEGFLLDMKDYYLKSIANKNSEQLSEDEKADLHRLTKSINPKNFWISKIQNKNIFMNLWEKDVYFEVEMPFKVRFKNNVPADDFFKKLINASKNNTQFFFHLEESFRKQINFFSTSSRFTKIPVKYWMSTIAKNLERSLESVQLPYVPGLTYLETLFLLTKLIMWDYISNGKDASELIKNLDLLNYEEKKTTYLDIISKWNKTDKDITDHNLFDNKFGDNNEASISDNYEKSEDYIFSTVKSKKSLKDLNKTSEKTLNSDIYSDDSTLLEAVKKILINWIKGDTNNIHFVDSNNSFVDSAFAFDTAVKKIIESIGHSFDEYLASLNLKNTQIATQLIEESGIFSLSFILQNFKYSTPVLRSKRSEEDNDVSVSYSGTSLEKKDEDIFPSVNYHKSIVISNSDKPAKLNDYDNATAGHSYKIVSQERTDNSYINRLKILSGNPLIQSKENFLDILSFKEYDKSIYKLKDSLRIMSRMHFLDEKFFKLIKSVYEYIAYPQDEKWLSEFWLDQLYVQHLWESVFHKSSLVRQGSRVFFNIKYQEWLNFARTFEIVYSINTDHRLYIDQFSSFFTVVSPLYAKNNNIKPISDDQYSKFKKLVEDPYITQEQWDKEYSSFILNPENYDSILNVNGNKLIVTGIGLTPDMIFPSHTYLNLISNQVTEGILFVDKYGYENIKYNSPSKWDEQYLSISYPQLVKDMHLEDDYRQEMSNHIRSYLPSSGSNDVFVLQTVKDAPILDQLVFLRSQYPYRLLDAIHVIVGVVLFFVGIVVLFSVWVLIKRYITASLKTFGVFVANGIYRKKIILNSSIFVIFPIIIGIIIGYLCSLALQPIVFGMVANIWYLMPIFNGFSISTLLYYIFIVSLILVPISWITSFFLLKSDVNVLMKTNSSFKQNKLIKFVGQHLNWLSSLWKFRISVIINTIGRGFVLASETVFLFVFTNFLFNNLNQFQVISDLELQTKSYGWNIPYGTPSEQSRMPILTSYANLGDTYLDRTNHDKVFFIKNGNSWNEKKVNFSENTPEIIGSGLKSVYSIKDLNDYFKQCKDANPNDWYSHLGIMDFDYVSNVLDNSNSYNKFLVSYEWEKNGAAPQGQGCNALNYTPKKPSFPKHEKDSGSIWYSSARLDSSNSKFSPDISKDNQLNSLYDYVPVTQENRKTTNGGGYEMIGFKEKKADGTFETTPLFKPLIDYYKNKQPLAQYTSEDKGYTSYSFVSANDIHKEQTLTSKAKVKGDFVVFNDKDYHPTLSRLYRDHSNYWLLTLYDFLYFEKNPLILKNKVVLPFILDYPFSIEVAGSKKTDNPWLRFSSFLSSYSPELLSYMNRNNLNFVNEIIKSRYGAFFVNRFMTKHKNQSIPHNHEPGKLVLGKKTWKVTQDIVAEGNKEEIEDGLYWIDPSKLLYQHDILSSDRFFIFRPDFLYLFYAVMKDPVFQTKDIAPTKISFNQHIYVPDYEKPFEEWSILGNVEKDKQQKKGLTASSDAPDYYSIPGGDQTYTKLESIIENNDTPINIFGIKQDSRGSYVKLKKGDKVINSKLYAEKDSEGAYPAIVNQFTAKYMNLSIGSTIKIRVENTFDRFTQGKNTKKIVSLKVVDIYDSYYKSSIYISQRNANEILGLDLEYGYNGIFTKQTTMEDLPFQLVKALFAKSDSGIYGYVSFNKNSYESKNFLNTKPSISVHVNDDHPLIPPVNNIFMQLKLGIRGDNGEFLKVDDFLDKYLSIYKSGTPFDATYASLDPNTTKNFVFSTLSDLIISIVNLFITIFTPLLVLSLLVITNLIIEDLRNLLTILNMLGFTYAENANTILIYLSLILVFSFLVGLPLSFIVLKMYVAGMLNSLSMYLPIYLRFDYVMASLGIILLMFGFSYYMSTRKTKSMYLPVEMKSLE